jgi:uncharacterized RDD family membrane protein YckC
VLLTVVVTDHRPPGPALVAAGPSAPAAGFPVAGLPAPGVVPAGRFSSPAGGSDRLVNGEAVEVDVRYARLGSRALALLLDIGTQILLILVLEIVLVLSAPALFGSLVDDAFMRTATILLVVAVFIAYPTTMETLTNGRSIGKRAMGLRVVREDGGPIRVRHALTRTLVGVAVEWPGLIMPLVTWVVSMMTMIFSPRGRRLGDLAAGTFVIHERTPSEWGWVPAMPPHLDRWATTLDLSGVDDDLALAARHYLTRSTQIREPHFSRFTYGLAEEIAAKIPQAPPPGTSPWLFLAAVLAERRRRAGQQVFTTRALTERIWPGFGRLDRFTAQPIRGGSAALGAPPPPGFSAPPSPPGSQSPGGGDAEQTQPLP